MSHICSSIYCYRFLQKSRCKPRIKFKGKTETKKQRKRNYALTTADTTRYSHGRHNRSSHHNITELLLGVWKREYIRSYLLTVDHHWSSKHSASNTCRQEWLSQRYVTIALSWFVVWLRCESEVHTEVLSHNKVRKFKRGSITCQLTENISRENGDIPRVLSLCYTGYIIGNRSSEI